MATALTELGVQVKVDMADFADTVELLAQINEEVQRQEILWGEQNHPLAFSNGYTWLVRGDFARKAECAKADNDSRAAKGLLSWDGILLEEVFEALAEDDAERAVTELVQVAAVALSAAKSVKRNGLAGKVADRG